MTTRTATFDFRTTGTESSTARVVTLTEALDKQRKNGEALAYAHAQVTKSTGSLAAAAKAAHDDLSRFGAGIGPIGVGLGSIAAIAPRAAAGLLNVGTAASQASVGHRLLNATMLTGAGVLATSALIAASYTEKLIEKADAYETLHAKIRMYTSGVVEANQIEQKLFATARESRQGVEPTTKLFARLSPEMKDIGQGPDQAVHMAGLINKALTIQGASGQEASYGVIDLIHALGTGQVQGRQLRGLQTEAPVLLRYIADNLQNDKGGYGVAYGQLAEMAKDKKLSSENVLKALLRAEPQIEKDFVNAPKTAGQQWTILGDQVTRAVGQISELTGAQKGVVDWLAGLATQADAFRHRLILNPSDLKPVEEAGALIGDAMSGIGALGGEAYKHIHDIITAGEIVLSLKLGEVMASWFRQAATAAASGASTIQDFVRRAPFEAGAAQNPAAATAARQFREQSIAADLRAATLREMASVRAARAAAAEGAVEEAQARARALRLAEEESRQRSLAVAQSGATQAALDQAAADRIAGEAAEIRARLEADATARIAERARLTEAAFAAQGLTSAGIGSAGAHYAGKAADDAAAAAMLSVEQRATMEAKLIQLETLEAQVNNTLAASATRRGSAEAAAAAEMATASQLAVRADAQEAEADALATRLKTEKAKAAKAAAAADAAAAGASEANTLATAGETAVTAEVTTAMWLKNAAMTAGVGIYNLLGGGIGLATIALGGLIYAIWSENEAFKAAHQQKLDEVLVLGRLKALTDELTTATWNSIPALRAQAEAIRQGADASLGKAREKLAADKADLKRLQDQAADPNNDPNGTLGLQLSIWRKQREVNADQDVVNKGAAEAPHRQANREQEAATDLVRTVQHINDELSRGQNDRGDKLSATDKANLLRQRQAARDEAVRQHDVYGARRRSGDSKELGDIQGTYDEAIKQATPEAAIKIPAAAAKPVGDVVSALRAALGALEAQSTWSPDMWAQAKSQHDFAAQPSNLQAPVYDLTTRKPFVAIGKDQAEAAKAYADAVRAIDKAGPAELNKVQPGLTKGQALQAVEAMFQYKLATSAAVKSDQDWIETLQRLGLTAQEEGTRVQQLTKAIDTYKRAHGGAAPAGSDRELARAEVLDRADAAKKSLGKVEPIFNEQYRIADEETPKVSETGSGQKHAEEVRQAEVIARAEAQTTAKIRADLEKELEQYPEARVQKEAEAEREIQAIRIASAQKTVEAQAKIDKEALDKRLKREQDGATKIEGYFHDLVMGGNVSDIGKRIGNDILEALYQELLGNPLRKLIQQVLHQLFDGQNADGTGGFSLSGVFSYFGSLFGSGGGGNNQLMDPNNSDPLLDSILASLPIQRTGGMAGVPAFLGGGSVDDGQIRGPGSGTSDSILALVNGKKPIRVSNEEFIVNARATKSFLPVLKAMNSGVPAFSGGGLIGSQVGNPFLSDALRASITSPVGTSSGGGMTAHFDNSIYAPGADPAQLQQIRKNQEQLAQTQKELLKGEPLRVLSYVGAANKLAKTR